MVVQLRAVPPVWPLALTSERFIAKRVPKAQKVHRVGQKKYYALTMAIGLDGQSMGRSVLST